MQPFEFKRFVPILKVDDEERMVYGYASTPTLDSDGEIITLEAMKKALPEYLQFPTLRAMHQPIAAGTVKSTEVRQGSSEPDGVYIGAKVIDDNEWKKVKEQVYRGFSIGGNVLNRVGNVINSLELIEISLVDVPANKKAKIELWKSGKITKDAETVWELSNIMIQLKDAISYCEFMGKDSKQLVKALEAVKATIATEALESEKDAQANMDSMMQDMGFMMSKNPTIIKAAIESLGKIKFDDNHIAETLRKVVKLTMEDKLKENEKPVDATPVDVNPATPVVPTDQPSTDQPADKDKEDKPEDGGETKTPEAPAAPVTPEEHKEDAAKTTLEKIEAINKSLDGVEKAKKELEDTKLEIVKSVDGLADGLAKVSNILTGLSERIVKLEQSPATLKSKASYLVNKEGEPKDKPAVSSELQKLLDRRDALLALRDQMPVSEFAKAYGQEAATLENKISDLNK